MNELLKTPPSSIEAEQAVLSGIFNSDHILDDVLDIVSADDFYNHFYQLVFKSFTRLHEAQKPVTHITVITELRDSGSLDSDQGEIEEIVDLASEPAHIPNITHYARIIADKSRERKLIRILYEASDIAYGDKSVEDKIHAVQQLVMSVSMEPKNDNMKSMKDIMGMVVEFIDDRFNSKSELIGCTTGFRDLDTATGGYCDGDLIIVAGRPSMGKTSFALNTLESSIGSGGHWVFFSLEMNLVSLGLRSLSSVGKINHDKVRKGKLEDNDWPKLTAAVGKLNTNNCYIDETPAITTSQIRSRCRKLSRVKKLDGIIVDYIQLMGDTQDKGSNENARISRISRNLKAIAKEFDCPLIALSQLNRNLESRPNKRPLMSDLRESGAIEQDADVIIMIYRDDYYNESSSFAGLAEAIIRKQRNGPTKTVFLKSNLARCCFEDNNFPIPETQAQESGFSYKKSYGKQS